MRVTNVPIEKRPSSKQTNVRLTDEGRRLIEKLSARLGVSFTDVIELAVRELAEKKGLWPEKGQHYGRRQDDVKSGKSST